MDGINSASRRIADIIGVIDEIAFQTNLLALNAAVEAARAGDQGRGFAVVASEVRLLASRSAAAAKEIKGLISASVESVADGTRLVGESGTTLGALVVAVNKVGDLIAEIATASEEQAAGIDEVGASITQMDGMTQQNALLVEEAAAASQILARQSQNLSALMSHYRVSAHDSAAPPSRPARLARS
jgi:methyl-accepting chemotaxis protein